MKSKIFLFSLVLLIIAGCTRTVTPVETIIDTQPNRLLVTSFESDGNADIDNWVSPGPPIVKFSNDVPINGGKFSIFLKARSLGAFVTKEVNAPQGNKNYRLIFWSKSTQDPGSLVIYHKVGDKRTRIESKYIDSKEWTSYTLNFNINSAVDDKILIELGGSNFASPQGYTFFDLIDLQIVE